MNAAIFEGKDFQVEDEGMYQLIDILLGHITKTVTEKPKTAHDVDDAMAHSIATALTLVYVLLLQSDMEQRSQTCRDTFQKFLTSLTLYLPY